MILVDQTAVPLATPEVISGLGGAVAEGQWILTANILPLAALMVFGGRLGDLLGLRRVFLAGALIFMGATAVAGGAQDMPMMIAARAVQGTGAALMMPTAVAITSAVYSEERRGTALGILAADSKARLEDMDRLLRSMTELERLIALNLDVYAVENGRSDMDLASVNGRAMARIAGGTGPARAADRPAPPWVQPASVPAARAGWRRPGPRGTACRPRPR